MRTLGAEARGGGAEAAPGLDTIEVVAFMLGTAELLEDDTADEDSSGDRQVNADGKAEGLKGIFKTFDSKASWAELTEDDGGEVGASWKVLSAAKLLYSIGDIVIYLREISANVNAPSNCVE